MPSAFNGVLIRSQNATRNRHAAAQHMNTTLERQGTSTNEKAAREGKQFADAMSKLVATKNAQLMPQPSFSPLAHTPGIGPQHRLGTSKNERAAREGKQLFVLRSHLLRVPRISDDARFLSTAKIASGHVFVHFCTPRTGVFVLLGVTKRIALLTELSCKSDKYFRGP